MAISHADAPVGRTWWPAAELEFSLRLWLTSHGLERHKRPGSSSWEDLQSIGLSEASITRIQNSRIRECCLTLGRCCF